MQKGLVLIGIAFAITFAVLVVDRLSEQALAVVVGAVCGFTASLPVSIGCLITANRRLDQIAQVQTLEPAHSVATSPQPSVIVVAPPQPQTPYSMPGSPYYYAPNSPSAPMSREFKIVGDE